MSFQNYEQFAGQQGGQETPGAGPGAQQGEPQMQVQPGENPNASFSAGGPSDQGAGGSQGGGEKTTLW